MSETVKGIIGTLITMLLSIVAYFLIKIHHNFDEAVKVIQKLETKIEVVDTKINSDMDAMRRDVDGNTKAIQVLQEGQLERQKDITDFYKKYEVKER